MSAGLAENDDSHSSLDEIVRKSANESVDPIFSTEAYRMKASANEPKRTPLDALAQEVLVRYTKQNSYVRDLVQYIRNTSRKSRSDAIEHIVADLCNDQPIGPFAYILEDPTQKKREFGLALHILIENTGNSGIHDERIKYAFDNLVVHPEDTEQFKDDISQEYEGVQVNIDRIVHSNRPAVFTKHRHRIPKPRAPTSR